MLRKGKPQVSTNSYCYYVCTSRSVHFTVPFSKASSLPEDWDYNTVVPLNSLQLEAI